MAFIPQTRGDILEIAKRFDDLSAKLKGITEGMNEAGLEAIKLQVGKAVFFLDYMDQEWIQSIEADWKKQKAKADGEKRHAQLAAQKKRRK